MAKLKDVAQLAGVSIAAVSLYVNGKSKDAFPEKPNVKSNRHWLIQVMNRLPMKKRRSNIHPYFNQNRIDFLVHQL